MNATMTEKRRIQKRAYYERNAEMCRQRSRDWYANNRERAANQRRDYVSRNRNAVAERKAVYKYGMTNAAYDAMLASQGGVCAICKGCEPDRRRSRLAIDHCHVTGHIRGLLCSRCNTALGLFGDNIPALEAAVSYLREPGRAAYVEAAA